MGLLTLGVSWLEMMSRWGHNDGFLPRRGVGWHQVALAAPLDHTTELGRPCFAMATVVVVKVSRDIFWSSKGGHQVVLL
jgi:hypothetical protein